MGAACDAAAERRVATEGRARWLPWRDADRSDRARGFVPDAVDLRPGGRRGCQIRRASRLPGVRRRRFLLMNLDLDGVAVSAGSACSAGKSDAVARSPRRCASPTDLATSRAVRVSLGWTTDGTGCHRGSRMRSLRAIWTMRPSDEARMRAAARTWRRWTRRPLRPTRDEGVLDGCRSGDRRSASSRSTSPNTSTGSSRSSRWTRPRRA